MAIGRPRLGSILVSKGIITQQELEAAVLYQIRAESAAGRTLLADAREGSRPAPRSPLLGEALISLGICTDVQIAHALAEQMEIPFVDLLETPPTPEALACLPREAARRHGAVPFRLQEGVLWVGVSGPATGLEERLQQLAGRPVALACAPESQVAEYLNGEEPSTVEAGPEVHVPAEPAPGSGGRTTVADPACAVTMVNNIIAEAARQGASDVYFEPLEDRVRVHYRIGGRLLSAAVIQRNLLRGIIAHIKLMCGMELADRPRPQDGRCQVRVDGRAVEIHASTLPGTFGESAILRVLS